MANDTTNAVHYEDMVGVRSRISWGALLGGSVIAIACSLLFTFFFAAVGLSLRDADVRGDAIGVGAIVAMAATMAPVCATSDRMSASRSDRPTAAKKKVMTIAQARASTAPPRTALQLMRLRTPTMSSY